MTKQWPLGWPQTPTSRKENGDRFNHQDPFTGQRISITVGRAVAMLRDELAKFGADSVTIWVDPRGDGVAAYFTFESEPRVMAADRFNSTAANMRSLGLAVEAMRQLKRHGGGAMMDRALAGFAALPPPRSCWEVLEIAPGTSPAKVEQAYRAKAVKLHPDRAGGSDKAMAELNVARDQALQNG
jgi:hypothetical protein